MPEQQGALMTLKIVSFMSTGRSVLPLPRSPLFLPLPQMFYRLQQWRKRAPCCLMVPSTAVLISWGREATAAQREAVSPPPTPPLRSCNPTVSTSWLWIGQMPAGRLLSKPSRKWQTWATRLPTGAPVGVWAMLKNPICAVVLNFLCENSKKSYLCNCIS